MTGWKPPKETPKKNHPEFECYDIFLGNVYYNIYELYIYI